MCVFIDLSASVEMMLEKQSFFGGLSDVGGGRFCFPWGTPHSVSHVGDYFYFER